MNFTSLFEKMQDSVMINIDEYMHDGIKHCSICNDPRQYKLVLQGKEYLMKTPCLCQQQELDAAENQVALIKKNQNIERLKRGITDTKYKEMTFDKSTCSELVFAKRYVDNFQKYKHDNIGLMILGETGTGKTYAAACIANSLIQQEVSVFMANMLYITDKMTSLFSDDRLEFIQSLQRYSLLIIDDFGVERSTEFACEQVYNLIETRYRCKKPLIITSNLTPDQLKTDELRLKRTYDRVKEMCHPIIMEGESIRKSIANDRYQRIKNELEG